MAHTDDQEEILLSYTLFPLVRTVVVTVTRTGKLQIIVNVFTHFPT